MTKTVPTIGAAQPRQFGLSRAVSCLKQRRRRLLLTTSSLERPAAPGLCRTGAEEGARVLVEDPAREPACPGLVEVAVAHLLLEHLGHEPPAEPQRAVALLRMPAVAAEHHPRL